MSGVEWRESFSSKGEWNKISIPSVTSEPAREGHADRRLGKSARLTGSAVSSVLAGAAFALQ